MKVKKKKKKGLFFYTAGQYAYIPDGLREYCVPIGEVKLWKKNPRINDEAAPKLAELIKANGFRKPIIIDQNNIIRAGNTAYKAAKMLEMKMIPVAKSAFSSEVAATAYGISDNKSNEFSAWDDDMLAKMMKVDTFERLDLGFTEKEMLEIQSSNDSGDFECVYNHEEVKEDAFIEFRKSGFLYPSLKLFEMKCQINKLKNTPLSECLQSTIAYRVADTYNKHRFRCSVVGKSSPFHSFNNDKRLKKVIRMDYKNSSSIKFSYLGFLSLVAGTQQCSNFRPGFAKYIYDSYCKDGGTVFDCSMGYGGRLVGFFASHAKRYIGTDPCVETYESNKKMVMDLVPEGKLVRLYNKPIEDFKTDIYKGKCDLCFTSPPYFSKEIYSNESTQSRERYSTFNEWLDGFLAPLLQQCFKVSKEDTYTIINIEDVKIKEKTYKLVESCINLAENLGFELKDIKKFELQSRCGRGNDGEIVYRAASESVLFFKK